MKKKDDLETRIDLDTDCRKTTGNISNYLELFYVRIRIERRETRISYTSREYKCLSVRLVGKNGEESGVRARIYIATTGPLARERNMRRARRRAQVVEGRSEREKAARSTKGRGTESERKRKR